MMTTGARWAGTGDRAELRELCEQAFLAGYRRGLDDAGYDGVPQRPKFDAWWAAACAQWDKEMP